LTSIRGYAELLRKDALEDDDARERALARIESEATRMGALVEDLLVLARMGESPHPTTKPVNLVAIVTDAVEDARTLDPSRTITLSASDGAIVEADDQRVEQLIHNLLQNALVHTPAGTPVDVRVERSANQIVLRVRDEGPGLDAEQVSHVFDRFSRGTASGRESGSGLGLFIVATVAKSLGGNVSVDTAPGKGASFTVVLPGLDTGPRKGLANGPAEPLSARSVGRLSPRPPTAEAASSTAPPAPSSTAPPAPSSGSSPAPGHAPSTEPGPDSIEVQEPDAVHH
jgi:two-component system OmpR family sensor kinase